MPMPMRAPDLTDEEIAAIVGLLRRLLNNDPLTFSPRLEQLKSALEKLDPKPAKSRVELLPTGPIMRSRRKPRR
jgi:hypothetical protein